ncbi:MAG: M48 family metallopeptidase [Firmicutes bacterium]|nr:M48 family metallopeptidase [Bacillota bacterium]
MEIYPKNIIKAKRKTLSLMIDANGELIIKAPLKMSDRDIYNFIKSKERWIETKQQQIRLNNTINVNILNYAQFLYLGNTLTPVITANVKSITPYENFLYIPAKIEQDKILKKVIKFYKDVATEILQERVNYFSRLLKLQYGSLKCSNNAKQRWGSCDSKQNITLNWRLVMLPPNVIDYVVVHELCHLLELNHTQNFWRVVQSILPKWKELRIDLKSKNYLLNLFR